MTNGEDIRRALVTLRSTRRLGATFTADDGTEVRIMLREPTFQELLSGGDPMDLVARHAVTEIGTPVFRDAAEVDQVAPGWLAAELSRNIARMFEEAANPRTPHGGSSTPRGGSG